MSRGRSKLSKLISNCEIIKIQEKKCYTRTKIHHSHKPHGEIFPIQTFSFFFIRNSNSKEKIQ